jgi:hypothetical protein
MKTILSFVRTTCLIVLLSPLARCESGKNESLPGKGEAPKSYQIANKKLADLLRPKDANNSDGTPIVLYSAQPWKCMTWKLKPLDDSTFIVQNHFTGKTFSLPAADKGNGLIQTALPKDAAKAVKWRFIKLDDGSYRIADPKSDRVLTAAKDEKNEFRIVLKPWEKKNEQKWELKPIDPAKLTM